MVSFSGRQSKIIPILEPEYVADKAVAGTLANRFLLVIGSNYYEGCGAVSGLFVMPAFLAAFRCLSSSLREVPGKSKWEFKMAFAMKGGGSRGGLVCH